MHTHSYKHTRISAIELSHKGILDKCKNGNRSTISGIKRSDRLPINMKK